MRPRLHIQYWGMLKIGSIVWGVRDMSRAIAFWTAALNYQLRNAPDEDWAVLIPKEGNGAQLALKLVTSEKAKRHHLDLYADDCTAEIERLLSLGAMRAEWQYPADADFTVLSDPDGNHFCVVQK
jgi:predicted enzyme related to lactoylglutathione lyase